jgi:hypothetical protein
MSIINNVSNNCGVVYQANTITITNDGRTTTRRLNGLIDRANDTVLTSVRNAMATVALIASVSPCPTVVVTNNVGGGGVINRGGTITITNNGTSSTTTVRNLDGPDLRRRQELDRGRWFLFRSLRTGEEQRKWFKDCTGTEFAMEKFECPVPLHPSAEIFVSAHGCVITDLVEDGLGAACRPPGAQSGDVVLIELVPSVDYPDYYFYRHWTVRHEYEFQVRAYHAEFEGLLDDALDRFEGHGIYYRPPNDLDIIQTFGKRGFVRLSETRTEWLHRP